MPRSVLLALVAVSVPLILASTCPGPTATTYTAADLTALERQAISAGATGPAPLLQAGRTLAEVAIEARDPTDQCPAVLVEPAGDDNQGTAAVDFGTGCEVGVYSGTPYTCSGSAGGYVNRGTHAIELTFDGISCNGRTLDGTAYVNYSTSGLNGTWNLTWLVDGQGYGSTGQGNCDYSRTTGVLTISSFAGTLSDGANAWSAQMSNLLVSYTTYQSYVPYGGTLTLTAPTIRELTIRFSAASPSTGAVEVSIAGSPFFSVRLSEL